MTPELEYASTLHVASCGLEPCQLQTTTSLVFCWQGWVTLLLKATSQFPGLKHRIAMTTSVVGTFTDIAIGPTFSGPGANWL